MGVILLGLYVYWCPTWTGYERADRAISKKGTLGTRRKTNMVGMADTGCMLCSVLTLERLTGYQERPLFREFFFEKNIAKSRRMRHILAEWGSLFNNVDKPYYKPNNVTHFRVVHLFLLPVALRQCRRRRVFARPCLRRHWSS